jgi:hypothetical protein
VGAWRRHYCCCFSREIGLSHRDCGGLLSGGRLFGVEGMTTGCAAGTSRAVEMRPIAGVFGVRSRC